MTDEVAYREPRIGEGAIPDYLDRLNIGAFLLSFYWALGYGIWPWFLAFLALGVFNVAVTLTTLSLLGRGLYVGLIRQTALAVAPLVLSAVFSLRANKLYWRKENRRIYSESAPKAPALVSKFVNDQRTWLYFGVGFLAVYALLPFISRDAKALEQAVELMSYVVLQLAVLGGAYIWDVVRRGRSGRS